MLIHGRCHCGNLSFELDWQPEPSAIPARACTCAFCIRHGNVWTACPGGTLRVTVADRALASRYAFESKTADFHVCTRCGVVPLATSEIEGRCYAVVNVNTFEDVTPSLLQRTADTFDGESTPARLARRKRNWIAEVTFDRGGAGR